MRVLLLSLFVLTPAAGGDFADFLRNWAERQQQFNRRQEDYNRRYDERYRRRDEPEPVGVPWRAPLERILTPEQSGLQPGFYDVPLPSGERVRLNVRPDGGRPAQPNAAQRRQILAEATALQSHIETVARAVAPVGDKQLESAAEKVQRAVRRMIDDVRDADWEDARRESERFTESFRDLVTRLDRYTVSPGVRGHIESASQIATRIDFALRDTDGRSADGRPPRLRVGYDRPQLLALTGTLADRGRRLERAFAADARDWRSKALGRKVRRVRQGGEDLQEAVLDGADFDTLVEEYEQFDEDWHRLVDSVERLNLLSPQLLEAGREIWEIDWALHEVLLVGASYFPDRAAARHTLDRVASSARRLDRELQLMAGTPAARDRNFWTVEQAAGQFAAELERLEGRNPVKGIEATLSGNLQAAEIAWNNLRQAAARIDLRRTGDVRTLMDRIEVDMNRLRAASRGDYAWRL